MIGPMLRRTRFHYAKSERGAAAVELAFALFLLTIPVMNVVDLAFYAFTWMQTQNAAQMGAQAAFSDCNTADALPAATRCYGVNTSSTSSSANNMTLFDTVNQGIQETALNSTVTLVSSQVTDGYFCSSSANVLTQVGSLGYAYADAGGVGASANTNDVAPVGVSSCSGYQDTNAVPGEYVVVNVTHTYQSIFGFVSVASLLPATMTATAYVRID
jgi:Flp pilus assembly protein TadG